MLFTFLLVLIGWIIFRSDNIVQAWDYLGRMCSLSLLDIDIIYGKKALCYILILLFVEWFQRNKQHAMQIPSKGILKYQPCRLMLYYLLILTTILLAGEQETFVYFQF